MDTIVTKPVVIRTPDDVIEHLVKLIDWAQMYPGDPYQYIELKRILRVELIQAIDQYALAQAEVAVGKGNPGA